MTFPKDDDEHDELGFYRYAQRNDLALFTEANFSEIVKGQTYQPNWHVPAIAHHFEEVAAGRIKRLLVTVPPRCLKSTIASVTYPAWLLGRDPTKRIVCISHTADLAIEQHDACRAFMRSLPYQLVFPGSAADPTKSTQTQFKMVQGGSRTAFSVLGPITGRGGSIIIVDDPSKAMDGQSDAKRREIIEWWKLVVHTRLDNPDKDAIVVVMQRLHEWDLAGYLLEHPGWTHLNLPAQAPDDMDIAVGPGLVRRFKKDELLDPHRISQAVIDEKALEMGETAFATQYLQTPAPAGGGIIKLNWLRRGVAPNRKDVPGAQIVQSWDHAVKTGERNDYSVCVTFLRMPDEHYLLHVFRQKLTYPDLVRSVLDLQQSFQADVVLIEDSASGSPLIQELAQTPGAPLVVPITVRHDKVTRMEAQSYKFATGKVVLPPEADWLDDVVHELVTFPRVRHDDQVDAISQYLEWPGLFLDLPGDGGCEVFSRNGY